MNLKKKSNMLYRIDKTRSFLLLNIKSKGNENIFRKSVIILIFYGILPVEALVKFPLPLPGSKLEHFNSILLSFNL